MVAEFATRLAVALPLVCLAAVAILLAVRHGWLSLPGFAFASPRKPPSAEAQPLCIACVKSLTPAARLAVVHFRGRDLLIGITGSAMVLLANADSAAPSPRPPEPEPGS